MHLLDVARDEHQGVLHYRRTDTGLGLCMPTRGLISCIGEKSLEARNEGRIILSKPPLQFSPHCWTVLVSDTHQLVNSSVDITLVVRCDPNSILFKELPDMS